MAMVGYILELMTVVENDATPDAAWKALWSVCNIQMGMAGSSSILRTVLRFWCISWRAVGWILTSRGQRGHDEVSARLDALILLALLHSLPSLLHSLSRLLSTRSLAYSPHQTLRLTSIHPSVHHNMPHARARHRWAIMLLSALHCRRSSLRGSSCGSLQQQQVSLPSAVRCGPAQESRLPRSVGRRAYRAIL